MIFLTGVTGKIGGETARQLLDKGASLRALVRDEAKAGDLKAAGVTEFDVDIPDAQSKRSFGSRLAQSFRHVDPNESDQTMIVPPLPITTPSTIIIVPPATVRTAL